MISNVSGRLKNTPCRFTGKGYVVATGSQLVIQTKQELTSIFVVLLHCGYAVNRLCRHIGRIEHVVDLEQHPCALVGASLQFVSDLEIGDLLGSNRVHQRNHRG